MKILQGVYISVAASLAAAAAIMLAVMWPRLPAGFPVRFDADGSPLAQAGRASLAIPPAAAALAAGVAAIGSLAARRRPKDLRALRLWACLSVACAHISLAATAVFAWMLGMAVRNQPLPGLPTALGVCFFMGAVTLAFVHLLTRTGGPPPPRGDRDD